MSALVDGQLDAESQERAWAHVLHCPSCRRLVEREGWLKRQLAQMNRNEPSARLLGSLYELAPSAESSHPSWEALDAWVAVDELEHKGRGRRRAGLALAGAGSVSAAVFGIASLGAAPMGLGAAPAGTPASALTRSTSTSTSWSSSSPTPTRAVVAPAASVHGRIEHWTLTRGDSGVRDTGALHRR